jgi:hypothetical protein
VKCNRETSRLAAPCVASLVGWLSMDDLSFTNTPSGRHGEYQGRNWQHVLTDQAGLQSLRDTVKGRPAVSPNVALASSGQERQAERAAVRGIASR